MALSGRDLEEKNTADQAKRLGFDYFDPRQASDRPLYPSIIDSDQRQRDKIVPLVADGKTITFGITIQTPPSLFGELQQKFNQRRVHFNLISETSLKEYQDLYEPPVKVAYDDIDLRNPETNIAQISQAVVGVRSADLFAYIVNQANRLGASDIHFEPGPEKTVVRLRVFGVLHPVVGLSQDQYRVLVGAVASAADISVAATDAQTGRISQTYTLEDGQVVEVDLRVETAPTIHGTEIVMRLFSLRAEMLDLDKLGFTPSHRALVDQIISRPSGLVLIVGPTGSGKTTTLYAIVNKLNDQSRKIITLEDPVEIQLPGTSQIPIDSRQGASFANGLRAVLRLDPDVLMVGEIRDEDTAKTALQAALTGHLVLSTYHAPSTAAALVRLLDAMRSNPLFLNALRLIAGQRLVRRLDPATKIAYRPDPASLKQLRTEVDNMPETHRPRVDWKNLKIYKPGRSNQNPFGFSGRLALREFMVIDDNLKNNLVDQNLATTANQLEKFASQKNDMLSLRGHGILTVLAGETSLGEIARVLG